MSRPQAFDRDAVIDAALHVFWERGLHRASVDDVLAASGLSRSSLYNSFGGKQELFERAVARYVEHQSEVVRAALEGVSLRDGLGRLFAHAVEDNNQGRGCLLVNGAAALADANDAEQRILAAGFRRMIGLVETHVRRAQDAGEIGPGAPADVAAALCASLAGLRVFRKAGMPRARLERAAQAALDGLLGSGT